MDFLSLLDFLSLFDKHLCQKEYPGFTFDAFIYNFLTIACKQKVANCVKTTGEAQAYRIRPDYFMTSCKEGVFVYWHFLFLS